MRSRRHSDVPTRLQPPPERWHQRFAVTFEYPVVFTRGSLDPSNHALAWAIVDRASPVPDREPSRDTARRHRVFTVIDDGLVRAWPSLPARLGAYLRHHGDRLEAIGDPVVVPGGEAAKNDASVVENLQRRFGQAGLDRHAFVLMLGGGAMLDAAGYAAATVHRGLRVIRMPSTVLAQNDAGIGVKNGVNALGTKNFLGSFAPPWAVINDLDFIETLEHRDKIAGVAEALKVGLIRDAAFFDWLHAHARQLAATEPDAMAVMIRRCAELHLQHIRDGGDPFETGSARPLDFGHWAAHRLEAMTEHALRHGEAVALGILLDARYACATGRLSSDALERVCQAFETIGLPCWDRALARRDGSGQLALLRGLEEFREHLGGELTITTLEDIGHGVEIHAIDPDQVESAVNWLRQRYGNHVANAVG